MDSVSNGLIFLLISPSGSGKTSILNNVINTFSDIERFITYTTRKPRIGEVNGRDYFFVNKKQFYKLIQENELVEWEKFYGHMYGSSRKKLESLILGGRDGITAYDVLGSNKLYNLYPNNIVTIFIKPPSFDVLRDRLIARYTNIEERELRLQRFDYELNQMSSFKYIVLNQNLDDAVCDVSNIIRAERCMRLIF